MATVCGYMQVWRPHKLPRSAPQSFLSLLYFIKVYTSVLLAYIYHL